MRIDHLVFNVDKKYQNDIEIINNFNNSGIKYNPRNGKRTKGFKVSNIWFQKEYLELVNILDESGGGWRNEWVDLFNKGYRGCTCLMIEVNDILKIENRLKGLGLEGKSERISYKIFGLFKVSNPWVNVYTPFLGNKEFQIGFQKLDDPNFYSKIEKRMKPNNNFGIGKVVVEDNWGEDDFSIIKNIFEDFIVKESSEEIYVRFENGHIIEFKLKDKFNLDIYTNSENNKCIKVENSRIFY